MYQFFFSPFFQSSLILSSSTRTCSIDRKFFSPGGLSEQAVVTGVRRPSSPRYKHAFIFIAQRVTAFRLLVDRHQSLPTRALALSTTGRRLTEKKSPAQNKVHTSRESNPGATASKDDSSSLPLAHIRIRGSHRRNKSALCPGM